jgi:cephalosporin hydroxylase
MGLRLSQCRQRQARQHESGVVCFRRLSDGWDAGRGSRVWASGALAGERMSVLVESATAVIARDFMRASVPAKYSYHFTWLGRPIIQYPADIIAMQQIIWQVQPDLIIETGVAHGGGLIFYASMLELNALNGGPQDAKVLGIDTDIRAENRHAIAEHCLAKRIVMWECDSVGERVWGLRQELFESWDMQSRRLRVLVCLDSCHTHNHVLAELNAYAPLVSVGSYCVVFDTFIEDQPVDAYQDRPWGKGNNPYTAVQYFLSSHPEFEPDRALDETLLISTARGGYLRRVA